jgi:hypothetical protein
MKIGFVKSGLLQGAFPYVTAVFAISLLLFGTYLTQAPRFRSRRA